MARRGIFRRIADRVRRLFRRPIKPLPEPPPPPEVPEIFPPGPTEPPPGWTPTQTYMTEWFDSLTSAVGKYPRYVSFNLHPVG